MVQVIGRGCRNCSDSQIVATAPLNQTTKIQLDVCGGVRPSCPDTAICSGTLPNAYQAKAVTPAHAAAAFRSARRRVDMWTSLPHYELGGWNPPTTTSPLPRPIRGKP